MDLRLAVNAVSDVVQNRPRPLREFDQIYMKTADMVLQAEIVARWADGKRLAFIGDGDAISVSVAYLRKRGIIDYGPSRITVFDFDQRICNAVLRFADRERLDSLDAELYNCLDAYPGPTTYDCFYTNPPYGASNNGESVKIFTQRGFEATNYAGEGLVVVADDPELEWPARVLSGLEAYAMSSGSIVANLMPRLHSYHLDDNPDLLSCNVFLRALPDSRPPGPSEAIRDPARLQNFYGRDSYPRVRHVLERAHPDYGKAHTDEYELVPLESIE